MCHWSQEVDLATQSIDAVRSGYKRERRPKKGPEKSLEIDLTDDPASLQSTAGSSRLIPLNATQKRESALTPEMIESVIQKLDDLMIAVWQLRTEHDNHIDALHAKLREHDLLISQLNDRTTVSYARSIQFSTRATEPCLARVLTINTLLR